MRCLEMAHKICNSLYNWFAYSYSDASFSDARPTGDRTWPALLIHDERYIFVTDLMTPPPLSTVVRASAQGAGSRGSMPEYTKDVKTGRFALLSLALRINELGNRLGGSESV